MHCIISVRHGGCLETRPAPQRVFCGKVLGGSMRINGRQLMNLVLLNDYGIHRCDLRSVKALERAGLVKHQDGNAPWAFALTQSGLDTIELHRSIIYGTGYRFTARYPISVGARFEAKAEGKGE